MSDNENNTDHNDQYYFSVGYHSDWSRNYDVVADMSHIKSDNPIITKREALILALRGTGHDPFDFKVTSFASISKEQYDCFEEEAERNRKRSSASSGCSTQ